MKTQHQRAILNRLKSSRGHLDCPLGGTRRGCLVVRPARDLDRHRDDPANPETGVFSTRSADRPNPIGLHHVLILSVEGIRVQVRHLEAVDRTPILDVKPILRPGPLPE